jgi:hypothetical protein
MHIDASQKWWRSEMRFMTGLVAFVAIVASGFAIADEGVVRYSLGNPEECKVVSGNVVLEHSADGYKSPGTVTLRDLKVASSPGPYPSNRGGALVALGKEFQVVAGTSYHLSAWIKAQGKRGWSSRTQSRALVKWYDSAHKEASSFVTPWAFGDYDWLEYSSAGVAPANAVTAQTFLDARISSLGPNPGGWRPTTFLYTHVTVSRTPTIAITTGKQCNLIFEGEPLTLDISVDDIPEGFENAVIEGVVFDYWRTPVDTFEIALSGRPLHTVHTVPSRNRGYYSVEWTLKKGGVPVRNSVIAVSVIPAPASRYPDEDSPFALDAGLSMPFDKKREVTLRNGTHMALCAGVRLLRGRNGPLSALKFMRTKEVDSYHILWRAFSKCLRNAGPEDTSTGSLHLREVYDGAKRHVQKYGDLVRYWEVWNEPDVFFFSGRAEEFAAMQKAGYLGAYAAGDPRVRVLLASWSAIPDPWHEDLCRNGVDEYFDIFNMHYYDTYDPEYDGAVGVVARIQRYQGILQKCEIPSKESWLTEMGYPCERDRDGTWWRSEQEQAVHAVQATCYSLATGMDKFFYFYLQEFLENGWYLWGITRRNWTPKPAYTAYANMTYELGKGRYIGEFDLGVPDSYGYVFESGAGPVLVAWAQAEHALDLPGVDLTASDIMGAPTSAGTLSQYPIYIRGIDLESPRFRRAEREHLPYSPPDIEKLATFLCLRAVTDEDATLDTRDWSRKRKEPLVVSPDEKVSLELKVCNFSDNAKIVAFNWKIPAGWEFVTSTHAAFDAGPWSENDLSVELLPHNAQSGSFYSIEVSGTAPGRTITPAYMRVKMQ